MSASTPMDKWLASADKRYSPYIKADDSTAEIQSTHIIPVTCNAVGFCTPASPRALCGQVNVRDLTPMNGHGYDEHRMRDCAAKFDRQFCGACVAHLYGDKP